MQVVTAVQLEVCRVIGKYLDVTPVQPIHRLDEDLEMDSMDKVEVWMLLEEIFGIDINDDVAWKFLTVQDMIDYIEAQP